MPTLSGKTIFVSGASRGIGLAIALRAAQDGANVALIAKTAEPHPKLEGTVYTAAEAIEEAGGQALPIVGDIREEEQVEAAVEQTVDRFGGIDIAINNASAINLAGTEALEMKRYDLMQDINTRGTFVVSKHCVPHLRQAENPHVLTLSPPLSLDPKWAKSHVGYTLAKYGMSLLHAGHGRGVPRRRHRLQLAVAADARGHSRGAEPAGRRRGHGQVAQARGGGRLRVRGPHPPLARVHRQLLPVRGRAGRGGGHRPQPVLRAATTSELQVDLFVEQ